MSNTVTVIAKGPNGKNKTFNVKVEPHVNVEAAFNTMAAAAAARNSSTNSMPPGQVGGRRNKRRGTRRNKRKGTRRNKRN